MLRVLTLLNKHLAHGKPPFFSLLDADFIFVLEVRKGGTWRSRFITVSVSVICAMVVKNRSGYR